MIPLAKNQFRSRPSRSIDLLASERHFFEAMHSLEFVCFEGLHIRSGQLVLDPWPTTVRTIKFGSADAPTHKPLVDVFELKAQVAEFFEYVRAVDTGEIRCLEVRHGLPFSMEVELADAWTAPVKGGCHG